MAARFAPPSPILWDDSEQRSISDMEIASEQDVPADGSCPSRPFSSSEDDSQDPGLGNKLREIVEHFSFLNKSRRTDTIKTHQLGDVLRVLGQNPTEAEIGFIAKEVDPHNTGVIDIDTLEEIASDLRMVPALSKELNEAFRFFDEENTGTISEGNLSEILLSSGETLSKMEFENIDKILACFPKTENEEIDYKQLVRVLVEELDLEELEKDSFQEQIKTDSLQ